MLITTGGTIDAQPYDIAQTPANITPLAKSLVPAALAKLQVENFEHHPLPPADSKVFLADGGGLSLLIELILASSETHILITHGTDALGITAVALYQAMKAAGSDKLIVFACSMVPLANESCPDGYANLTRAVKELRSETLEPGVYITANEGQFFEGNERLARVRKEFDAPSPDKRFFYLKD